VFEGITARVRSLAEIPTRWPRAPESKTFKLEIRQATHGSKRNRYRILFCIEEEPESVVRIYAIRHSARQLMQAHEFEA
jgi:hypothetical protein